MYALRQTAPGPKKMLALDGGGLRGIISLRILRRLEGVLRERRARNDLVLADEFDYVAGTSTGAIIAAAISLGFPVARIEDLYANLGPKLFKKRPLLGRIWSIYDGTALGDELARAYGPATTLGSDNVRTLLMCVLQNASTDSPWPVSNCTTAKYNRRDHPDNNLDLSLWQVVRASTAAPIFFPPEQMHLGKREFMFQDGGVTAYNNPAFIQFVMATAPAYGLEWPTGLDKLLTVSVGTGTMPRTNFDKSLGDYHLKRNLQNTISFLMNSASIEQDRLCRLFGDCRHGADIDREVGALAGPGAAIVPLFSYLRYNVDISQAGLDALGLGDIRSNDVAKLDAVAGMDDLARIGDVAAETVSLDHLRNFV